MINICNGTWKQVYEFIKSKNVYCFGSGNLSEWLSEEICGINIAKKIKAFIDNDTRKVGEQVLLDGNAIPIISFQQFLKCKNDNTVVLICSMYYKDMIAQMDKEEILHNMNCFIDVFIEDEIEKVSLHNISRLQEEKIPKIIHYCWFGKNPIPDIYKQYMDSWKKYCPDYDIIRWDENNYDVNKIRYTKEAYHEKKWAFVSDFARLDIIYNYGGIYLDIDVEVVQNLDLLLKNEMFCGFEKGNCINTGLGFGACREFEELGKMRDLYKTIPFKKQDGSLNLTACTKYQTDYMKSIGLVRNGKQQDINGIRVFPRIVFAPYDFYGSQNMYSESTFTIHHYAATWFQKNNSKEMLLQGNTEILQRMKKYAD